MFSRVYGVKLWFEACEFETGLRFRGPCNSSNGSDWGVRSGAGHGDCASVSSELSTHLDSSATQCACACRHVLEL